VRWRKEVLKFIVRKGEAHYEEIRQGVSPGHLIPTSTLTYALNDLTSTGFTVMNNRGTYRSSSDARRALEILENAEREGKVTHWRGEEALIGRMIEAHLLKPGKKVISIIEPNPKRTRILNIGKIAELRCGHNVPIQEPWPDVIVCPQCGATTSSAELGLSPPRDIFSHNLGVLRRLLRGEPISPEERYVFGISSLAVAVPAVPLMLWVAVNHDWFAQQIQEGVNNISKWWNDLWGLDVQQAPDPAGNVQRSPQARAHF